MFDIYLAALLLTQCNPKIDHSVGRIKLIINENYLHNKQIIHDLTNIH